MEENGVRQCTDAQRERFEELLPSSDGRQGRPFRNNRRIEGSIYRYRADITWRALSNYFGQWQTVWKRHQRYAADGTWDAVVSTILTDADTTGDIDWTGPSYGGGGLLGRTAHGHRDDGTVLRGPIGSTAAPGSTANRRKR